MSGTTPQSLPEVLRPPLSRGVALLLDSRIPARLAWVGEGGVPRVVPIWFLWNGAQLVMTSFASGTKLAEIDSGTRVTVSIDTDVFPYRGIRMSGPIALESSPDLTEEYREAARRYLGPEMGRQWCDSLEGRAQVRMMLSPISATSWDLSTMPFVVGTVDD